MGFAEATIAFIVIGLPTIAIFVLISRMLRHREKRLELEAQIAVGKTVRNEQLEQRVRVLERIVTDKGIVVADEIERLRDERVS
ncbi:MAG: hypothetical protein QOH47_2097 [Sphingomonadales bacterium]|jgi:hypothetical protein|nr:hypothetical protein [Sphingomonadales bacterium]